MNQEAERDKAEMKSYAERVTGPIVYAYVDWVISEAVRRGITRLWFLARDGYLPYLVAREICRARGIALECRYFYCSRSSLRSSSYHLVDDDELSSYMFTRGYQTSAYTLFARLGVGEEKRRELLLRANIECADTPLGERDFSELCKCVRADAEIFEGLRASARDEYPRTVSYMRRVGFLEQDRVCIVDSGWTGSIQRSLRILLDSLGYGGKIIGFYFGMYRDGRAEDGEYLTYYFSSRKGLFRRVFFNNNVFESMLSAPHPMTRGYAMYGGVSTPLFACDHDPYMLGLISSQISGVLAFCKRINVETPRKRKAEINRRAVFRKARSVMVFPRCSEVRLFSRFYFCDDFTEQYKASLADESMKSRLRDNMLIPRVMSRILRRRKYGSELFWSYGVVAYLPAYQRPWYRMNLLAWDFIKALRAFVGGS